MKLFGVTSIELLMDRKNKRSYHIYQSTNAFEYYILKTILLRHYEEYMRGIMKREYRFSRRIVDIQLFSCIFDRKVLFND